MISLRKHLSNAAKARWKKTPPEERIAIAKRNAAIRWEKPRNQPSTDVGEKENPPGTENSVV